MRREGRRGDNFFFQADASTFDVFIDQHSIRMACKNKYKLRVITSLGRQSRDT